MTKPDGRRGGIIATIAQTAGLDDPTSATWIRAPVVEPALPFSGIPGPCRRVVALPTVVP